MTRYFDDVVTLPLRTEFRMAVSIVPRLMSYRDEQLKFALVPPFVAYDTRQKLKIALSSFHPHAEVLTHSRMIHGSRRDQHLSYCRSLLSVGIVPPLMYKPHFTPCRAVVDTRGVLTQRQ